jgi:hypothetical protein
MSQPSPTKSEMYDVSDRDYSKDRVSFWGKIGDDGATYIGEMETCERH